MKKWIKKNSFEIRLIGCVLFALIGGMLPSSYSTVPLVMSGAMASQLIREYKKLKGERHERTIRMLRRQGL